MERNEQDYRWNQDNRRSSGNWQDSDRRNRQENYRNRHQDQGSPYGMPDRDADYRNVRSSEDSSYGWNTSRPAGGYGSSGYQGSTAGQDRNRRDDQWSSRNRSAYDSGQDRNPSSGRQSGHSEHYRYGDPNPYMNYSRNGGYERTRGTGWRSESDTYEGTSYSPSRYNRQDNSYVTRGEGRRYDSFGRDEEDNYGHNMRDRLDHGHIDRNEHRHNRFDNDYSPGRYYGSFGRDRDSSSNRPQEWHNVSDKYSHHHDREQQRLFDHTDNDYPATSRHGDPHRSGPNWRVDSAASEFSQSDLRG